MHGGDRGRKWAGRGLVVAYVAPLLILLVRAAADVWRAPAVLPQEWGTRALDYVLSGSAGTLRALVTSVAVALVATAVAVVLGWPVARRVATLHGRAFAIGVTLVALPLLVPEFATGTGLAAWFIRLRLADTIPGLVLAHLVYVLPYVVLLLTPGFGATVEDLEEAASAMGADRWRRLWFVTVPAVRAPLATAALLGFLVSLSQYGTSLAVGGGKPTLPILLVPFVRTDPQIAAALSAVFLIPAVAALALATRAARQPA
ncbi:MAG: ABC transporter permease subunit [Nitriliruptorales bacterium]|nr:ABC transporter permease subunit [Nitriliruptorales bacterium]